MKATTIQFLTFAGVWILIAIKFGDLAVKIVGKKIIILTDELKEYDGHIDIKDKDDDEL